METRPSAVPLARVEQLALEKLDDELLVYDLERHRSHCLSRTAALVWGHCDGQTTPAEIAGKLQQELAVPAAEDLVWLALDRLEKAHLLAQPLARPAAAAGVSRRQVLSKLRMVGGIALLPVVTSLVVPTAAAAASPSQFCVFCCGNCQTIQGDCERAANLATDPDQKAALLAQCAEFVATCRAQCTNEVGCSC